MAVASRKPRVWVDGQIIAVKPHVRGWIHFIAAPLSLAAMIVLISLAPSVGLKWACVAYGLGSFILFAVSALYHLLYWTPRWEQMWRRLDHSNIFLLIAGTYTPLSVALLDTGTAKLILTIVWVGALFGIIAHMVWLSAPRWLYVALYIILGWVAIWFLPDFWHTGGPAVVWLILAGGITYTLGAVVYAQKWPNPSARWFGFHEVFHACTVAAWACQCVAVYLAILAR